MLDIPAVQKVILSDWFGNKKQQTYMELNVKSVCVLHIIYNTNLGICFM